MTTRSRVELYEQIRKLHECDDVSIRELSRRFRVHRRDVRRALESPLPPQRQAPRSRPSLLDEWKPTIDAWLELAAAAVIDDGRRIGTRGVTVGEHFALEAEALRALPSEGFEIRAVSSHRVDRKSRVSVRGCLYSVPARFVGRRVDVWVGAETIEVVDGNTTVATHPRGLKGDEVLVLDHYLEVLSYKPGALAGSTALARARAGGAFGDSHERLWAIARRKLGDRDGTRALIEVLLLHRTLDAAAVTAGIEGALAAGSCSAEVVAIEARRAGEQKASVIPIGEGLSRFDRPAPTVAHYDQLLEA